MRIIAGIARGRRLAAPKGTATRPTSARAREGLFATVTAIRGPLPGARVLDLFAGSGAIGLEALSRGAVRVVFVESDARAAQVIRANLAAVALPGGELVCDQVQRFLDRGPGAEAAFDLAVADAGLAGDERLARALHDYFTWTTTTTMARYHRSADDVPDGLTIPRGSWGGLQE